MIERGPHCAVQLEERVTHTAPHAHRVPYTVSPQSPRGTARPTSTGEGAKHISRSEECAQCDSTNEYTLPAHRGEGLSHA